MLVSFMPAGDDSIASSRIRVYSLQKALSSFGIDVSIGYSAFADILVVQKRLDRSIIDLSREHKERGALLIYDCDDLGSALDYWAPFELRPIFLELVDLITTNTEEFKTVLIASYSRPVEIIPDIVDYYLVSPVSTYGNSALEVRNLLWFGNPKNINLLEPYLPMLHNSASHALTVCTGPLEKSSVVLASYPRLKYIPWTLQQFPSLLQSAHLTFLPHGLEQASSAKSNNRMITSIAWGVPAIVSRTPAYQRTASLAGIAEACFDSIEEAKDRIEMFSSRRARESYLSRAQPVIWKEHSPLAVARLWCKTISKYL